MDIGIRTGTDDGQERAWNKGFGKGLKIAVDWAQSIGFIEGYVHILLLQSKDEKKTKKLRKIKQLCDDVVFEPSETALDQVQLIRKLAKQAKIPLKSETPQESMSF